MLICSPFVISSFQICYVNTVYTLLELAFFTWHSSLDLYTGCRIYQWVLFLLLSGTVYGCSTLLTVHLLNNICCFQFGDFVNKATVNIGVQVFV